MTETDWCALCNRRFSTDELRFIGEGLSVVCLRCASYPFTVSYVHIRSKRVRYEVKRLQKFIFDNKFVPTVILPYKNRGGDELPRMLYTQDSALDFVKPKEIKN